jgi:V/A-type H+-transporting ATPase subunit F
MVGVEGRVADSGEQAEQALEEALGDSEVGIIIITEPAADLIRSRVNEYVFSRSFPLIVEVPDRGGRSEDRPGLKEMVNRAIGISV